MANKTYSPVPFVKTKSGGNGNYFSLVQLHATMTLNDSQSLAGHTSSTSTLTTNSSLKIQLMKCKKIYTLKKERRHAAFAAEKDDVVDLVSKANIATTKKLLLNKVGSMELQLVAPPGNATDKY